MKTHILRWILLLTGGLLGALLGATHCYILYKLKGPFPNDSFGEKAMLIAGLSTFFICLYNTGILGFSLFGLHEEARTVLAEKKGRMFFLNLLSVGAAIGAWFLD